MRLGDLWCFTESLFPANASPAELMLSDSTATAAKYANLSNFIANENAMFSFPNRQYLIALRAHYSSVMSEASCNGSVCKCVMPT